MEFSLAAAATLLLLPLSALASPVAAPVNAPVSVFSDSLAAAPVPVDDEKSAGDLDGRAPATLTAPVGPRTSWAVRDCTIVNVSTVANCRSGPGTNYPITRTVKKGTEYLFDCYKRGTCVNGNCTWDKLVWNGGSSSCYVSGAFTDSRCTMAAIGPC